MLESLTPILNELLQPDPHRLSPLVLFNKLPLQPETSDQLRVALEIQSR